MAKKKKHTLNQLSKFLKSQAPEKAPSGDFLSTPPKKLVEVEQADALNEVELSVDLIKQALVMIASQEQKPTYRLLFQLCREILQEQELEHPAQVMLLNNLLYLEHVEALEDELKKGAE